MRIRHVGMFAVVWAAVGLGAVRGGEAPAANPAALKVGAYCLVELNPARKGLKETVTAYEGTVTKANDQGVGLTVSRMRRTVTIKPFGRMPVVDRLFRSVGIAQPDPTEKNEVWLPAATVHSARPIKKIAAAQTPGSWVQFSGTTRRSRLAW